MSTVEDLEDREDQPHVGWKPRVITGGKGPPEGPTENWLSKLRQFTTFVCRQNNKSVDFELYHVVFISHQGNYLLKWELPDGKVWDRYVDPAAFSKLYKEYEILGVHEQEEQTPDQGENNEQRDRTDRPSDVVLHEAVPGVDQMVSSPEEPGV